MPAGDHLNPSRSGARLTYDDFMRFPEDGNRHELIDGEHCVSPSPGIRHQRVSFRLSVLIGSWLDRHSTGHAFAAPFDIILSLFHVVEPDLVYFSNETAAVALTGLHAKGVPELVVEIVSWTTRARDESAKRRLYERFGVVEYWLVDPETETIRVHRRVGDLFGRPVEFSVAAADVLTTSLLRGLEMPLGRIFEK